MSLEALTQPRPAKGRKRAAEDSIEALRRAGIAAPYLAGRGTAAQIGKAFGVHPQTVRRLAREERDRLGVN